MNPRTRRAAPWGGCGGPLGLISLFVGCQVPLIDGPAHTNAGPSSAGNGASELETASGADTELPSQASSGGELGSSSNEGFETEDEQSDDATDEMETSSVKFDIGLDSADQDAGDRCNDDFDCGPGHRCYLEWICAPRCHDADDCMDPTHRCQATREPARGQCFEPCTEAIDCPSNWTCRHESCVPQAKNCPPPGPPDCDDDELPVLLPAPDDPDQCDRYRCLPSVPLPCGTTNDELRCDPRREYCQINRGGRLGPSQTRTRCIELPEDCRGHPDCDCIRESRSNSASCFFDPRSGVTIEIFPP